jgi:predicted metal-binding protein
MPRSHGGADYEGLVRFAMEKGATRAKAMSTREIVVDKRVRLKCAVPRCADYGRNLMCPPNVISVDEFREILGLYRSALIIQVEADVNSSDKSKASIDEALCKRLSEETKAAKWQLKLHRLVNAVEAEAFKRGFYLAAGLSGGECCLCSECVTPQSGKPCRHPFEARPSMEAMGIDVIKTSKRAGMQVSLSSPRNVRWTGLILLE